MKEKVYKKFSELKIAGTVYDWGLSNPNNKSINTVKEALFTMRNALAHCSYSFGKNNGELQFLFEGLNGEKLWFNKEQLECFVNKCVPHFIDVTREQIKRIDTRLNNE